MSTRQTILIVDHERNTRKALARELKPNYDLLLAEDGLEAVRVYESHQEQIATILIDLGLPLLDGRAVADWVRPYTSGTSDHRYEQDRRKGCQGIAGERGSLLCPETVSLVRSQETIARNAWQVIAGSRDWVDALGLLNEALTNLSVWFSPSP